jgi:hypothetical protein
MLPQLSDSSTRVCGKGGMPLYFRVLFFAEKFSWQEKSVKTKYGMNEFGQRIGFLQSQHAFTTDPVLP